MSNPQDPIQMRRAAFNAIMGSTTMSDTLRKAMSSPIGSTDRKRGQKVASLLKKYRPNDGQGGPGMMMMREEQAQQMIPGDIMIMPAPPERNANIQDGKGGPGILGFGMPGLVGPYSTMASAPDYTPETNLGAIVTSPYTALRNVSVGATDAANSAVNSIGNSLANGAKSFASYLDAPAGSTWNEANRSSQPTTQAPQATQQPTQQAGSIPWGGGFYNTQPASTAQAPQFSGAQSMSTQYPNVTGSIGSGGSSTTQTEQTEQTDQAPQQQYSAVQSAVDSNMGPDAFALSMLSNPDALRQLPGFKDLPASAIPTGVSLSDQVNQLSDALKQEHHLDELLNQRDQMASTGATLTDNLTDYIRGRDQFLNQTQGMIDSYTNKMRTMDLANPNTAARAQQYMTYLYELRGRQNKRYIEFLNSSVNQYNAQLNEISTHYDNALSAYESELSTKSQLTQSEYNMYYTALSNMYNTVSGAPALAKQAQLLDAQIQSTYAAAAKDGAGLGGKGMLSDLSTIRSKGADALFLDSKTGNFLPTVNSLSGFIDTVSADGSVSPTSAMQYAVNAMINGIDTAASPADAQAMTDKYLSWASDMYKNAGSDTDATNAALLRSTLQQALSGSLKTSVSGNQSELNSLRTDLQNMITPGFFSRPMSETAFVSKYKNLLGDNLSKSLWGGVSTFAKDSGSVQLPTNTTELANWISDIASDSYVANIWNTSLQQNQ